MASEDAAAAEGDSGSVGQQQQQQSLSAAGRVFTIVLTAGGWAALTAQLHLSINSTPASVDKVTAAYAGGD